MRLLKKSTKINFMAYRKITGVVSTILVLLSIASLFAFKLNFGIEFTGGTQFTVQYDNPADLDKIRSALKNVGIKKYEVKYFGTDREVKISVSPDDGERINKELKAKDASVKVDSKTQDQADGKGEDKNAELIRAGKQRIKRSFMLALLKKNTSPDVEIRDDAYFGSQVGEELTEDGGMALLTALLLILVYVSLRFEYRFALGSVAALAHDVLIILGIFSVTQMEFTLAVLAASLAVIGYSLNDTIVVFDRIRENFRRVRNKSTLEVMNVSINETLSRTIITSLTTLLVLVALFLFGGETLRGFSVALILGVIVGTYSSIFVASNAAMRLGVSRKDLLEVKKEGVEFDGMP